MLHQIFIYSDKVMLAAGKNTTPPIHHLPSFWMNEEDKRGPY